MARAARLARKHRRQFVPGELATGFTRRVLAVLGPPQPAPTGVGPRASAEIRASRADLEAVITCAMAGWESLTGTGR